MAIRIIAADMDGTLLSLDKKITPRTQAAVQAAMDAGALFVLNSGRMAESIMPYARQLDVNAPIICFNGALTYDTRAMCPSACIPLDKEVARRIMTMVEELGLYAQGYWGHEYYCAQYNDKTRVYEEKNRVYAHVTQQPLSQVIPSDVYKLLVILDPGQMRTVLPRLARAFEQVASCSASSETYLEIVAKGASKGAALRALGASCGVAPSEIMAFGDELNDLSMLTMAGYGYAMANASEAVRRQVRLVAPSNGEDGLAQVMERCAQEGLFAAPRGVGV
ncbi:MAG TPA: HAD family phosphatase [Candidatus Excrementavichristensenella intestinipullorum]|nr:HAD family phosphatase [Candidatus Excrementavichristensenella intestinipullorum]